MLSFDGVGCHDWLRGIDGAEEAALRAIRLVKTNDIKVIVSMALHMGNIDSIFKTYERIKELGVDFWKAAPILNTGNWKEQPENQIDISKIYDRYLELLRLYKKDGFPMRLGLGGFFQGKPGEMETYKIPYVEGCGNCEREMDSLCEAAKISPYLLPNGKILPCIAMSGSMMEDIAPNIFEKDMNIEKALRNSQVEEYTKKTYQDLLLHNKECAECKDKYRCSGCRANALASGGFFEKDPYACVFIKGSYEEKSGKL